jgi:hypothetical protein
LTVVRAYFSEDVMRYPFLAAAGILLNVASVGHATDWKAFDDPTTNLFTDQFAESINKLSAAEKEAAVKRLHDSLKAKDVEIRRRRR